MFIFSGEGTNHLLNSIAEDKNLTFQKGSCELSRFPNGENKVWIKDDVNKQEVVIFQNFCSPVDQNIIQFCLMVDAVKRLIPKKITGVIPWLGYAKQDKVFRKGEALAAEVVAKIISSLPIDKLFLLDIHHSNIKNFFSIPVEELSASDLFIDKIRNDKLLKTDRQDNWCVIAPDFGALERNKYIAENLNLPLFQIKKERDLSTGKIKINGMKNIQASPQINNPLQNYHVLMFDDMILSGGTIVKDTEFLKNLGVKDIYFFATHLDVSPKTFENLKHAQIKKIFTTDSLFFNIPEEMKDKIIVLSAFEILKPVLFFSK